jgi:hypothetical protein
MANWFGVTSAINIQNGIFSNADRFNQTVDTISSIRDKCPDSKVVLLDGGPLGLYDEQQSIMDKICDKVIVLKSDPMIKWMHVRMNIQQLKSPSELYLMEQFLHLVDMNKDDRVFKISGRYKLSDRFDIATHTSDKAVFGPKFKSCKYFDRESGKQYEELTEWQYRTRLYSFPGTMIPEMKDKYNEMINFFWELYKTSFSDVEHVMYKFMDHDKVLEVPIVGLTGIFAERDQLVDE